MRLFINEIARCIYIADPGQQVLPSLLLAQACLESNGGKSKLAIEAKNLFGVKGRGYLINTQEYLNNKFVTVKAEFQLYASWQDSVNDQIRRFTNVSRYKHIADMKDYKEACYAVYKSGYATDPKYPEKLINMIKKNKLHEFDQKEVENIVNRQKIIDTALMLQANKVKYKLGAKAVPPSIPKLLDCSGFVRYCYLGAGQDVPDGTYYQFNSSNPVKHADLRVGDIGFLHDPGQTRGTNHIGIYAGDGKWLHCNYSRNGITLEKTNIFPYTRRFKGVNFSSVDLTKEEDADMATDKEKKYGKLAIENLHKNGVINSTEHIDDLDGDMPAWKAWVVLNNIYENLKGAK
jgi:hypothetical protein